jgi:hypothetical protein
MTVAPFRSACFFSTNNGQTVERRVSAQEEQMAPLPGNVTNVFRFDEKQPNNAGLVNQWATNAALFTMAGSQVLVNGQPAEFDPPGLLFQALENAAPLFSKLANTQDALTREEQAQLGALAFRANGLLV